MSAKKNKQARHAGTGKSVDPAAVVLLTRQVRDLLRFHHRIGITSYPANEDLRSFLRKKQRPSVFRAEQKSEISGQRSDQPAAPSLESVNREIVDCRRCWLAEQRSGQVLGHGAGRPKLLVLGDWSQQEHFSGEILFGREEDGMLQRMMEAIGLAADEVYVSNMIKCCPLDARPDSTCARQCFPHLSREVAALKPPLILAMGDMAASQLLGTSTPLVRLRGRFHPYRYPDSTPAQVMPTFHPRFLLENPEMKKMVWLDLQRVQGQLK